MFKEELKFKFLKKKEILEQTPAWSILKQVQEQPDGSEVSLTSHHAYNDNLTARYVHYLCHQLLLVTSESDFSRLLMCAGVAGAFWFILLQL